MVNNYGNTQRVTIMARKSTSDDIWNEIFDSLVLDNEPPFEYIKNVLITTKAGVRLRVSAIDFAHILERERYLTPEESDILSCKLAINFDKVRRDVDDWAEQAMYYFDHDGEFKPKKAKRKPAASESKTKTTKSKPKTDTKKAEPKKPATKKPATKTPAKKPPAKKSTPSKKA